MTRLSDIVFGVAIGFAAALLILTGPQRPAPRPARVPVWQGWN